MDGRGPVGHPVSAGFAAGLPERFAAPPDARVHVGTRLAEALGAGVRVADVLEAERLLLCELEARCT